MPHPGEENLKKIDSVEKAREMGAKGGVASGVAKREKKSLKEKYAILDAYYTQKISEAQTDKQAKKILDETGYRAWKRYQMINDPKVPDSVKEKIIAGIDDRDEGKTKELIEADLKHKFDKIIFEVVDGRAKDKDN